MKTMSLIAGAGILKSEPAFALALRGDLPKKFLWEIGGLFPHPVSGYADQSVSGTNGSGPFSISSHVDAYGEMHMALLYPLYQQERLILDGGAGFSLGFITNRADEQSTVFGTPSSSTAKGHEVSPSPYLSLGAAYRFTDRFAIRFDAGWVTYSNHNTFGAYDFDLGFKGIIMRPAIEVRL